MILLPLLILIILAFVAFFVYKKWRKKAMSRYSAANTEAEMEMATVDQVQLSKCHNLWNLTQTIPSLPSLQNVPGVCLPSQSASEKHNQEKQRKKKPHTFAHLVNFSEIVSAMFDNHKILLF